VNVTILRDHDFNADAIMQAHKGSTALHGSEFKPWTALAPFFSNHELWPFMQNIMIEGGHPGFLIDNSKCTLNTEFHFNCGKNKSAIKHHNTFCLLVHGEV
jgi:hypothetical protein